MVSLFITLLCFHDVLRMVICFHFEPGLEVSPGLLLPHVSLPKVLGESDPRAGFLCRISGGYGAIFGACVSPAIAELEVGFCWILSETLRDDSNRGAVEFRVPLI